MYEQTSMISTSQAEAKPAARYYEINEDTARNAHYCVHMSDYQPGSATNGYRAAVDEAAALVEARKSKVSPYYHDKLDALLDRYARRLAQWTNDYNRNQASYPSQFISGAGNYNMKKHEKQMSREDTLWKVSPARSKSASTRTSMCCAFRARSIRVRCSRAAASPRRKWPTCACNRAGAARKAKSKPWAGWRGRLTRFRRFNGHSAQRAGAPLKSELLAHVFKGFQAVFMLKPFKHVR